VIDGTFKGAWLLTEHSWPLLKEISSSVKSSNDENYNRQAALKKQNDPTHLLRLN